MSKTFKTVGELRASRAEGEAGNVNAIRSRKRRRQAGSSTMSRFFRGVLGIIWILAGLVLAVSFISVWYGSGVLVGIIDEINQRDFSGMSERERLYEEFFDSRADSGFVVERDNNRNFQGVISYMWRIKPPSMLTYCEFGWKYTLQDTSIRPTTNAAAMLDIRLGLITEAQARQYELKSGQYNPDDPVARGIVYGDLSLSPLTDKDTEPDGVEPLPPLITPDQGLSRQSQQESEQREEAVEDTEGSGESGSGPSSDVIEITPET